MLPLSIIAVIALGTIAVWNLVNLIGTIVIVASKQLVPADRGIALYFMLVSLVTAVGCSIGFYELFKHIP